MQYITYHYYTQSRTEIHDGGKILSEEVKADGSHIVHYVDKHGNDAHVNINSSHVFNPIISNKRSS